MVLLPSARAIAPLALPEATATESTFTVALDSVSEGVTVRLVVMLGTFAV